MSWSYSRALVEEFSDQCLSDTGLSALLSTTPTPDQSYWPDKTTEHSRLSRFGMKYGLLTGIRGEELLTWFLEASRARTSALPEAGPDWTAKGQGYGEKWLGLLGKYDPASCSLKTAQLSLLEDSTGCCPTLPRWGLMLDGELYPQPTPALRTEENESGSLEKFPTPNCFDAIPDFADRKDNNLLDGGRHGVSLRHLVKIWPTPTTSASKGSSQNSLTRKDGRSRIGDRLDHSVMASDAGQLNPDWVEWLMGWPIGHTALSALETGRFQEFEQQHGSCFMETKEAA